MSNVYCKHNELQQYCAICQKETAALLQKLQPRSPEIPVGHIKCPSCGKTALGERWEACGENCPNCDKPYCDGCENCTPSPTAAEGERGQYEDCSQSPDRTPNFAPADRGAVQTALPSDLSPTDELLVRYKCALENLTPGGSEFAGDPEYCANYLRDRIESLSNIATRKVPPPLSAEELAPLRSAIYKLLSTNTIGPKDGQAIVFSEFLNELDSADRELAKRLPGVAVVKKS